MPAIGFDGNEWWAGCVFDGELFLLDGVRTVTLGPPPSTRAVRRSC